MVGWLDRRLVRRSVCHNFLKGREVPCSYRITICVDACTRNNLFQSVFGREGLGSSVGVGKHFRQKIQKIIQVGKISLSLSIYLSIYLSPIYLSLYLMISIYLSSSIHLYLSIFLSLFMFHLFRNIWVVTVRMILSLQQVNCYLQMDIIDHLLFVTYIYVYTLYIYICIWYL